MFKDDLWRWMWKPSLILVYNLWPLSSLCCDRLWRDFDRQLMLSVSWVHSVSRPGSGLQGVPAEISSCWIVCGKCRVLVTWGLRLGVQPRKGVLLSCPVGSGLSVCWQSLSADGGLLMWKLRTRLWSGLWVKYWLWHKSEWSSVSQWLLNSDEPCAHDCEAIYLVRESLCLMEGKKSENSFLHKRTSTKCFSGVPWSDFFFFFKGFTTFKHVESVNFSLACSKLWFYFAFHLLVLTHYKTFHIFHKLNTHFPFRHLIPFLAICSSTCDWIKSVWFACLNKTKTQLHLSN